MKNEYFTMIGGEYWTAKIEFTESSIGMVSRGDNYVFIYPDSISLASTEESMTNKALKDLIKFCERLQLQHDRDYEKDIRTQQLKTMLLNWNANQLDAPHFKAQEDAKFTEEAIKEFINDVSPINPDLFIIFAKYKHSGTWI